jgi:hypothetical protein
MEQDQDLIVIEKMEVDQEKTLLDQEEMGQDQEEDFSVINQ